MELLRLAPSKSHPLALALLRVELLQRDSVRPPARDCAPGPSRPVVHRLGTGSGMFPHQSARCAPGGSMVDVCWDPSPGRGTGWHYPGSARPSSGPSHAVERVTSTVQSEQVPDPPHPARLGRCHHPGQYLAPALIRRTFKSTQAAGFSGGGRPSTLLLCSTRAASRPGGRPTLHSPAVHYYILMVVRNTHARWNLHDHVCWFHVFSSFRTWAGAGRLIRASRAPATRSEAN